MSTNKVDQVMRDADDEDELAMPIIVSDVLQTQQPKTKKRMLSLPGSQQQTPSNAGMSQQSALSPAESFHSPSKIRLAVHIRSSPITPFTPINAPATGASSAVTMRQAGRPRGRPPRSETPKVRPPTPDAIELLETKVETPSLETRKRGRPKGWKPGTPYSTDPNSRYRKREARAARGQSRAKRQVEGRAQGRASDQVQGKMRGQDQIQGQEPKRRGRPPRPLEPSVRQRYLKSTPDYTPYKCEWDLSEDPKQAEPSICPAELQNMDTLRRHVFLIHGDADPLICRYSHCKDRNPPLEFETEEEFDSHMEKKHFAAYLWHRGEGYQNYGIWTLKQESDKLPPYLFDKDGNQVSPSVMNQRLESDLEHKERKRRLRRLLYQQNENAPSEEEWKKQMLGTV